MSPSPDPPPTESEDYGIHVTLPQQLAPKNDHQSVLQQTYPKSVMSHVADQIASDYSIPLANPIGPQEYNSNFGENDNIDVDHPPMIPYQYDPTPGPKHAISSIGPRPPLQTNSAAPSISLFQQQAFNRNPRELTPIAYALFQRYNATRLKRSAKNLYDGFSDSIQEDHLRVIVSEILDKVLGKNQELSKLKATIRDSRSVDPVNFNFNVPISDQVKHHGHEHHQHDHHHHDHHDHHDHPPQHQSTPNYSKVELPQKILINRIRDRINQGSITV